MNNAEEKLNAAFNLTESKKYSEALDIVNSVISENPKWFKGYHEKAKIYARKKFWNNAIETVDEAIFLNKNEPMLYFSKARWLIQGRFFHEAIEDLTCLIKLEEKLNDTYYLESAFFFRALASNYLGNYEDVLADCEKVRNDYSVYVLNRLHSKVDMVSFATKQLEG